MDKFVLKVLYLLPLMDLLSDPEGRRRSRQPKQTIDSLHTTDHKEPRHEAFLTRTGLAFGKVKAFFILTLIYTLHMQKHNIVCGPPQ